MCGIIGIVGKADAGPLLGGLKRLEYRGYDSAGIATSTARSRGAAPRASSPISKHCFGGSRSRAGYRSYAMGGPWPAERERRGGV